MRGYWHTCIIYCHLCQIYLIQIIQIIKNFKWTCVELPRERYIFWGAELSFFPRVTHLSLGLFLSHCVHHSVPWLFNVYSQFSFFFYSEITSNMETCHVTVTSMILSDILHHFLSHSTECEYECDRMTHAIFKEAKYLGVLRKHKSVWTVSITNNRNQIQTC